MIPPITNLMRHAMHHQDHHFIVLWESRESFGIETDEILLFSASQKSVFGDVGLCAINRQWTMAPSATSKKTASHDDHNHGG